MVIFNKKRPSPYGIVKFKTIDEYHASFPVEVQEILQQLRVTIKLAAPEAIETISYNIPTFKNVVSYAVYKKHIGFYPGAKAIAVFTDELKKFKTAKGTIQFSLEKPLPLTLIKKIIKFRLKEMEKSKLLQKE